MRSERCRAFSLIELVTVMIIIGILASMAVPRFANYTSRHRVEAAARRIVADLSLARRQARMTSASRTVEFDVTADDYRLVGTPDPDRPSAEYRVSLGVEPYRATIVSADFGGDATLVFDGYGAPDSGGTVVVQAGTNQQSVTVDPDTGRGSIP